jgi:hypothetical protein
MSRENKVEQDSKAVNRVYHLCSHAAFDVRSGLAVILFRPFHYVEDKRISYVVGFRHTTQGLCNHFGDLRSGSVPSAHRGPCHCH